MLAEQNIALVQRVIDVVWNNGDLHLADELFGSSYVNHGGLIPDLLAGPEMIKIAVSLYRTAFPSLRITVDDVWANRDEVVFRWSAWSGAASTEEQLSSVSGTTRTRIVAGQIVESWTVWHFDYGVYESDGPPPTGGPTGGPGA